jgi:hypothetical protein
VLFDKDPILGGKCSGIVHQLFKTSRKAMIQLGERYFTGLAFQIWHSMVRHRLWSGTSLDCVYTVYLPVSVLQYCTILKLSCFFGHMSSFYVSSTYFIVPVP